MLVRVIRDILLFLSLIFLIKFFVAFRAAETKNPMIVAQATLEQYVEDVTNLFCDGLITVGAKTKGKVQKYHKNATDPILAQMHDLSDLITKAKNSTESDIEIDSHLKNRFISELKSAQSQVSHLEKEYKKHNLEAEFMLGPIGSSARAAKEYNTERKLLKLSQKIEVLIAQVTNELAGQTNLLEKSKTVADSLTRNRQLLAQIL